MTDNKETKKDTKRVSFARKPSILFIKQESSSPYKSEDNPGQSQENIAINLVDESIKNDITGLDMTVQPVEGTAVEITRDLTEEIKIKQEQFNKESAFHPFDKEQNDLNEIKIENILNEVEGSILLENQSSQRMSQSSQRVAQEKDNFSQENQKMSQMDSFVHVDPIPIKQELEENNKKSPLKRRMSIKPNTRGPAEPKNKRMSMMPEIQQLEEKSSVHEKVEENHPQKSLQEVESYQERAISMSNSQEIPILSQELSNSQDILSRFSVSDVVPIEQLKENNLNRNEQVCKDINLSQNESKTRVFVQKQPDILPRSNTQTINSEMFNEKEKSNQQNAFSQQASRTAKKSIDQLTPDSTDIPYNPIDSNSKRNENTENQQKTPLPNNNTGDLTTNLFTTADLSNLVRQSNDKPPKKVLKTLNEKLESIGVRFLDDLITKNTRKSTISARQSKVPENLYLYYKYYVNERVSFFSSFLEFMDSKMVEHEKTLVALEKDLQGVEFESKSIKSKKQECRNKVKITWHELRKSRETLFNNKIEQHCDALEAQNKHLSDTLKKKIEEKERTDREIEELENKLGENSQNCTEEFQSLEKMERQIEEQTNLIKSLQNDILEKTNSIAARKKQMERDRQEEEQLRYQIRNLEEKIRVKTVDERECEEMRKKFFVICTFYQIDITQISEHSIHFKFMNFTVKYDQRDGIPSFYVESNVNNEMLEYFCAHLNRLNLKDSEQFIEYLSWLSFIYEELAMIEKKCSVTVSIPKQKYRPDVSVSIRIDVSSPEEKKTLEVFINDELQVGTSLDNLQHTSIIDIVEDQ